MYTSFSIKIQTVWVMCERTICFPVPLMQLLFPSDSVLAVYINVNWHLNAVFYYFYEINQCNWNRCNNAIWNLVTFTMFIYSKIVTVELIRRFRCRLLFSYSRNLMFESKLLWSRLKSKIPYYIHLFERLA